MIVYKVWDEIKWWNVNICDGWCYMVWLIGWMGGMWGWIGLGKIFQIKIKTKYLILK